MTANQQKSIQQVQVVKFIFEMDMESTQKLIDKGLVDGSLSEFKPLNSHEQYKAGAVGFIDRADADTDTNECFFIVYSKDKDGILSDIETEATAQAAFVVADELASHYKVPVSDQSKTAHHLVIDDNDVVLSRHFELSDAESALNTHLKHGEDAHIAESSDFPVTIVKSWRDE